MFVVSTPCSTLQWSYMYCEY